MMIAVWYGQGGRSTLVVLCEELLPTADRMIYKSDERSLKDACKATLSISITTDVRISQGSSQKTRLGR